MTDTPLRANPEDRPLPPSGGGLTAAPSGVAADTRATAGAPETAPAADAPVPAKPPATPGKAAKPSIASQTRPIGQLARPPRDWRRAWAGFLVGVIALVVAIGLAWTLWDMAGPPRTAEAPAEELTQTDLAELEALLDGIGFPPGKIDGVIDGNASAAIRDFQTTAGLPVDGAPSAALLEELRAAQIELTGGQ